MATIETDGSMTCAAAGRVGGLCRAAVLSAKERRRIAARAIESAMVKKAAR